MNRQRPAQFWFPAALLAGLLVMLAGGVAGATGVTRLQTEPVVGDPIEPDGQIGGITNGLAARGDFVYLGVGPRLVVLDLSGLEAFDNYDDFQVGQTPPLPDIVRDVVVDGSYAYVAAGTGGLRVIDISDPTAPREVAALAVGENARAIDHEGTTVYLGDNGPSGLHVIDVSDPTAPRELGAAEWRAGIWEISVAGDYAYVADGYDMFIFDVADPSAPRQLGSVGTNCSALDVALAGDYAYVADHDNCGLLIADISDPTIQTHVSYAFPEEAFYLNPTLRSSDQHESVRVEVAGQYAYVAHKVVIYADNGETYTWSQLTIFDITNPAAPDPVARFNLNENRPYSQVTDLVIDGNAAYLSTVDGWLYVVDLTDLRLSNPVDHHLVLGPVVGVVADEGQVSAATPNALHDGFESSLDRSNFLLRQTMEERIVSWVGEGGVGYMTTEADVIAFDLHGVDELFGPMPTELGRGSPSHRPFHTALDGNRLWLFYYRDGEIVIADATSPGQFSGGGAVPTPEALSYSPSRVVVGNGIAYLFYFESPPWMIDLRGDTPQSIGFLGEEAIDDLAVIGNVAYAAATDGLRRYDLTDPAAPRRLDPLPGVAAPLALGHDGPYLFVSDADARLHVFDTTIEELAPVAVLRAPPAFIGASVADGRLYVAGGDSGLWSYPVPGLRDPDSAGSVKKEFDNFPLSEAILVYSDNSGNLVLENVETGVVIQLTDSGDVTNYSLSPTRQHILYGDPLGRRRVLSLEFRSDGRLKVMAQSQRLPPGISLGIWSPDGSRLAYRDENQQTWVYDVSGELMPLPEDVQQLGGWSYDSQWLSYCTPEEALIVLQPGGQSVVVDEDIDCEPGLGPWAEWSPSAFVIAYTDGEAEMSYISSRGMQPAIYNVETGDRFPLPVDTTIVDWSPDGRFLAVGVSFIGMKGVSYDSFTIVDPQGQNSLLLPGDGSGGLSGIGWWRYTPGMAIFNNYHIADDLSAAEPVADALLSVAMDGMRWVTGQMSDGVLEVFCGTPDDPFQFSLLSTSRTMYPDEIGPQSGLFQPGVEAAMSPEGNFIILRTYEGRESWRRHFMTCLPDRPMPIAVPTVADDSLGMQFSVDERWVILSTGATVEERNRTLYDTTQPEPAPPRALVGERIYHWLVTPTVAPPVTQVNAIAGHVTDHSGAPLPGAEVRAGGLTTTTNEAGAYHFSDISAGSYTVAVTLAGYVFAAPAQVDVPPAQVAVDFQAEPPASYILIGRVTDCAGQPVPGVAISADGAGDAVTTDADGRYTLADLERRSYSVRAAAEGRAFLPDERRVDLARYAAGETLTVDFTATTPERDEFCMPHLEIIQVVQDEYNSAPLIAGKPAVLRAYLHCPNCDPDETATGTLQAFRADGTPIPAQGQPFTAGMDRPSAGVAWATHRADLGRSLNFLLPPEWLEGDVRFRVSANDATAELDVTFEPGKPLRIYHVPYTYMLPSDPLVPRPAPTPLPPILEDVIAGGYDALTTLLPIARRDLVYAAQTSVRQSVGYPFDQNGKPRINAERYLDALNGYWLQMEQTNGWQDGRAPNRLVGWVANTDTHATCCAGIADARFDSRRGAVTAVAMDSTILEQLADVLGRLRFPLEALALVHELGHLLDDQGLMHTPYDLNNNDCLNLDPGETTTDFPVFTPRGSTGDIGIYIDGSSYTLLSSSRNYDIMSYCYPMWMSLHTYKRFHNGFMPLEAIADNVTGPESRLLISGRVLSATQTVEFDPIFQVEAVAPPTPDAAGDYCVELRDAAGASLGRSCFSPSFRESITGGSTDSAAFHLALPWAQGATAAVVTHGDDELGRVTGSDTAPTVAVPISPQVSEDGASLTISWEGADPDGDELVYNVGLSGARGYIPLAFGIRQQQVTVDARQLPGGEPLNVVVEVSDGFHSRRSESPMPLDLPAKPPVVTIEPVAEESLIAGQPFWLFGVASDVEDGALPEEALVWSANGQELGRGSQLFAILPPGEHTVTLSATDSDGDQAMAETTLLVGTAPEETTEETPGSAQNWLGWVLLVSGVVLLGGLLFLMWSRRRLIR